MKEFDFDKIIEKILNSSRIEGFGEEKKYKKGEHIFGQGDVCRDVFCVRRGLIKIYYNTLEGKEWIKTFIADKGILGSRISQMLSVASPFSALCLEDTEVIKFPYELFEDACFEDLELARTVFRFTQWLGVKKEIREYNLLCLSVEEAYLKFVRENPKLICRLTQIDIARYLGITPIALSRIKKRLA